jgi:divalent metal cation (Fe/Co/Zn/Cd) transporter
MLFFFNPRGNGIQIFSSIVISIGLSMVGLGVGSYIIRQFFQLNINRKHHVITSGLGTIIMLIGCLIFWIGKLFN